VVDDGRISLEDLKAKMKAGVGIEELTKKLDWKDFEGLVAEVFSANGFRTFRNFRFSSKKRRYEVDVIALERPRAVVVDCKHWGIRVGKSSALRVAALAHLNRTVEFSWKLQEFPAMNVQDWGEVSAIPVMVTLYQERISENAGVLVVPLFKLNAFIDELRNGFFESLKAKVMTMYSWYGKGGVSEHSP
jgi:hypothetical protein